MRDDPRRAFFDSISTSWDEHEDIEVQTRRLTEALTKVGLSPSERVLDLGSGTGNLTRLLASMLGPEGMVVGADFSMGMLGVARDKLGPDQALVAADAHWLPFRDASFDRVVCFAVWPHFEYPEDVADELCRVLVPGGSLHVWHMTPREELDRIHREAHPSVARDMLPRGDDLARLLSEHGFWVWRMTDFGSTYAVDAKVR